MAPESTDAGEGGGMIVVRLNVDADKIGTGFRERFDVMVRFAEHQVRVEEKLGAGAAEGGESLRAEGKVRHKMAIHDVAVQPWQTQFIDDASAGGEVRVVAGKERRIEERGGRRRHGLRRTEFCAESGMTNQNRRALPHVKGGVSEFRSEGVGEKRERLKFVLDLAAVGERLALDANRPPIEEIFSGAIVVERGGAPSVRLNLRARPVSFSRTEATSRW